MTATAAHTSLPLTTNRLLAAIPEDERAIVEPRTTFVELKRRDILYEPERPIEAVYFMADGIASILSVMTDGTGVETATIGREGMVGLALFHGVDTTPEHAMVQIPGSAFRVEADAFREMLPDLPNLIRLLHRFSVVMFTFAAQNSGCNRKHAIEERCARWLLMVADRLGRETLELTHDFMAQMLGVRRASVTEALASLEKRGFVETARGRVRVANRDGLRGAACECYGIVQSTVHRLLDGRDGDSPLRHLKTAEGGKSTLKEPFG